MPRRRGRPRILVDYVSVFGRLDLLIVPTRAAGAAVECQFLALLI